MTEMKKKDMSAEVKEQFKWFKLGCLIGENENILERFEEIYFPAIKDEVSLDERIENEVSEDESNDYIDYILSEVKDWDKFEELYLQNISPNFERFYLLMSGDFLENGKRCGRLEWEVMEKFDEMSLSIGVYPKSLKDDVVPDKAKKIEEGD